MYVPRRLLEHRVRRLLRRVKMMLDGYNPEHPLNQKSWEAGVVSILQKEIELVKEALSDEEETQQSIDSVG